MLKEGPIPSVILSSSLPNDSLVPGSFSLIPEDFSSFQDLLTRKAEALSTQADCVQEIMHTFLDILQSSAPGKLALPINEALSEPTKALWNTVASMASTAKHTGKHYHILMHGYECFYSYTSPNSLVVTAAN